MRRRPSSQNGGGYNNQHRRQRHGGGGQNSGGQNRPRKNYSAMREKYLNQARDALSSGDRVMAEYFFQHADHCYRMMVEEGYNPRQPQQIAGDQTQAAPPAMPAENEEMLPAHSNALPAFITAASIPTLQQEMAKDPVMPQQSWEERDAS